MTSESQAQIVRDNQADHGGVFQVARRSCITAGLHQVPERAAGGGWRPPNRRLEFVETPLPSGQMVNPLAVELAEHSGGRSPASTRYRRSALMGLR
jgi:hypothetical protein